jgi:hypothetical protein
MGKVKIKSQTLIDRIENVREIGFIILPHG